MKDFDKILTRKNVTQKEIADMLGKSEASVSNYNKPDKYPLVENLIKIADFLDVSTDELLGRNKPTEEQSKNLTEQQKYLIKLTNQFNDEYMEKLIEQAEMYAIRQKEKEKSFNFQSPKKNNAS